LTTFDECFMCNWCVHGPTKRERGMTSTEMWCGCGRIDFYEPTEAPCPMRLPIVEVEATIALYPRLFENCRPGTFMINPEASGWLEIMAPTAKIKVDMDQEGFVADITFFEPKEATLFKMFWCS
jgi:hypothetical protein